MAVNFELGQIICTKRISEEMKSDENFYTFVYASLAKYICGHWGDTCADDVEANNNAIKDGERILAVYKYRDESIWIITEWDRSVTTVLFPEEY